MLHSQGAWKRVVWAHEYMPLGRLDRKETGSDQLRLWLPRVNVLAATSCLFSEVSNRCVNDEGFKDHF